MLLEHANCSMTRLYQAKGIGWTPLHELMASGDGQCFCSWLKDGVLDGVYVTWCEQAAMLRAVWLCSTGVPIARSEMQKDTPVCS